MSHKEIVTIMIVTFPLLPTKIIYKINGINFSLRSYFFVFTKAFFFCHLFRSLMKPELVATHCFSLDPAIFDFPVYVMIPLVAASSISISRTKREVVKWFPETSLLPIFSDSAWPWLRNNIIIMTPWNYRLRSHHCHDCGKNTMQLLINWEM